MLPIMIILNNFPDSALIKAKIIQRIMITKIIAHQIQVRTHMWITIESMMMRIIHTMVQMIEMMSDCQPWKTQYLSLLKQIITIKAEIHPNK
jgi:hypothetical protein